MNYEPFTTCKMEKKYLIFTDRKKAILRNDDAFKRGEFLKLFPEKTKFYSEIKKHPEEELFALVVDTDYLQLFTPLEINNSILLPSDWFN